MDFRKVQRNQSASSVDGRAVRGAADRFDRDGLTIWTRLVEATGYLMPIILVVGILLVLAIAKGLSDEPVYTSSSEEILFGVGVTIIVLTHVLPAGVLGFVVGRLAVHSFANIAWAALLAAFVSVVLGLWMEHDGNAEDPWEGSILFLALWVAPVASAMTASAGIGMRVRGRHRETTSRVSKTSWPQPRWVTRFTFVPTPDGTSGGLNRCLSGSTIAARLTCVARRIGAVAAAVYAYTAFTLPARPLRVGLTLSVMALVVGILIEHRGLAALTVAAWLSLIVVLMGTAMAIVIPEFHPSFAESSRGRLVLLAWPLAPVPFVLVTMAAAGIWLRGHRLRRVPDPMSG